MLYAICCYCVAGTLVISANTSLYGLLLYGGIIWTVCMEKYVLCIMSKNCVCNENLYVRCKNKDTINSGNFNFSKTSICKFFNTILNWNWGCETLGKGLSRSSLVFISTCQRRKGRLTSSQYIGSFVRRKQFQIWFLLICKE